MALWLYMSLGLPRSSSITTLFPLFWCNYFDLLSLTYSDCTSFLTVQIDVQKNLITKNEKRRSCQQKERKKSTKEKGAKWSQKFILL